MGDTGATNAFMMRFLIGAVSLQNLCPGSLDAFYEPVVLSTYALLDGCYPAGLGETCFALGRFINQIHELTR